MRLNADRSTVRIFALTRMSNAILSRLTPANAPRFGNWFSLNFGTRVSVYATQCKTILSPCFLRVARCILWSSCRREPLNTLKARNNTEQESAIFRVNHYSLVSNRSPYLITLSIASKTRSGWTPSMHLGSPNTLHSCPGQG